MGAVLHNPGTPGAVIAHRSWISTKDERSEPSETQVHELFTGRPFMTRGKFANPHDLVPFMLLGAKHLGIPEKPHLSIILNKASGEPPKDWEPRMWEYLESAMKRGAISRSSILKVPATTRVPMVNTLTGEVEFVSFRKVPLDKWDQPEDNPEWDE